MGKAVFQLDDGSVVSPSPRKANKDESGFSPQAFAKTLSEDLKANRIALPTLPDVALEALVVINDIESSVNDLVKCSSRDLI